MISRWLFSLSFCFVCFGQNTESSKSVTAGVVWRSQHATSLYGGPQSVHVLEIDLKNPKLEVHAVQGEDCETTSSIARRSSAIAGVNGGFFCLGTNSVCNRRDEVCPDDCPGLGLLKRKGTLLSRNCDKQFSFARAALGLEGPGAPLIASNAPGSDWPEMTEAIGGGPNLVRNGIVEYTEEGFPWVTIRAPRTAVGLTADGKMLLVTVDGRRDSALGMTIPQLADLMRRLGCESAMNLDGGGSTTMYVRGSGSAGVVNQPSGGTERKVSDGLFVFAVD